MAVRRHNRGFSLIEILISIILVGVSIAALVMANGSFTMANNIGADISTAEFLIEQIRELTTMLPVMDPDVTNPSFGLEEATLAAYDDVDDFDDFDSTTLGAPIGADRTLLSDFTGYTQEVTVQNISPLNFSVVASDGTTDFVRVTVTVSLNGSSLSTATWIRARY